MARRSSTRSVLLAVALGLAAAGLVGPAAAPAAAATTDVVLEGGGWGHGRGMSQWGAQGRALAGRSAADTLAFYYPGTTQAVRPRADIRVQVGVALSTAELAVSGGAQLRHVTSGATAGVSGDGVRFARTSTGRTQVQVRSGSGWQVLDVAGFPATGVTGSVLLTSPQQLGLRLSGGAVQRYRGSMTLVPVSGNRLDVVNTLPREQYLYSVVAAEMPSWFEPAALQAQAVAARSYAWSNCSAGATHFDVRPTTTCQVYRGTSLTSAGGSVTAYESTRVRAAVDATAERVLQVGTTVVRTEFSSSNGGWTAGGDGPSRADDFDGRDPRNANHRWTQTVPAATVERAWPRIGDLRSMRVLRDEGAGPFGGRVAELRVVGSAGTVDVSGEQARTALGLKSTLFDVQGARASDVLTYDQQTGRRVVSRVQPGGAATYLAGGTWPRGLDDVVSVDLPDGRDGVLTYDRGTGAATLSAVGEAGTPSQLWTATWSPGWDTVIAVEGDGTAGSEVLTYRSGTGRAVLSDLPTAGSSSATLWQASWSPGWDTIIAAEGDGDAGSEVLTYRSVSGRAVLSDLPVGGGSSSTVWMRSWSPGWRTVAALEGDGSPGSEVLTYRPDTGRAVLSDLETGGSTRTLWLAGWSKGWDHVVPVEADGTNLAEVLTYDDRTGRAVISDLPGAGQSPATLWLGSWTPGWDSVVDLRPTRP
ncbi:SpoIID/LytB domain-containing protein [Jannaschia sp. R86511]|uniref:SpoIID/LytB domain-containing protein n=1 Tax=Jannaschia sp. R86511 TaxID=3093853 RepID=UPI0036D24C2D